MTTSVPTVPFLLISQSNPPNTEVYELIQRVEVAGDGRRGLTWWSCAESVVSGGGISVSIPLLLLLQHSPAAMSSPGLSASLFLRFSSSSSSSKRV